jgi:branched-chain amino acid transport system substrate-binding protein
MNQLINIYKVPVIIGGGSSIETLASAPIANEKKVVLISPISSASKISEAGPFIYRTCPTDNIQANDLGSWIVESGYNNIAIIFVNSTWGISFNNDLVKYLTSKKVNLLFNLSSDPGETNFRSQLSLIKSKNPQALIFLTYAKEGGTLVRQTRELGLKQAIFGADPWSQQDFRTGAGDQADGIRYTTPVQFDGESFKTFRDKFLNKYKGEPDIYASNGYDCMMLIADAIKNGKTSGEEIRGYFDKTNNFMGATGITKFDQNGDVVGKHFGRFIIQAGQPKKI